MSNCDDAVVNAAAIVDSYKELLSDYQGTVNWFSMLVTDFEATSSSRVARMAHTHVHKKYMGVVLQEYNKLHRAYKTTVGAYTTKRDAFKDIDLSGVIPPELPRLPPAPPLVSDSAKSADISQWLVRQ